MTYETARDHMADRRRDARRMERDLAFTTLTDPRLDNRIGFRFSNGAMRSLPYMQLIETEYNTDVGIIMSFIGHRVTLSGRNLATLYLRIEEELICEIIERHQPYDFQPTDFEERNAWEKATYIEQIGWEVI